MSSSLFLPRRQSATPLLVSPATSKPYLPAYNLLVLLIASSALCLVLELVEASRWQEIYQPPLSESLRRNWGTLSERDRLEKLIEAWDEKETEEEFGLKLGDVRIEGYQEDIKNIYETYFTSSSAEAGTLTRNTSALITSVLSSLNLSRPSAPQAPFPQNIYTTDAPSIPDLPNTFSSWRDMNVGWDVTYFSDVGIEEFLTQQLGNGGESAWNVFGVGLLDEFRLLPRGVLKADFFRYLIMLLKGGVYTDTDTAILKPLAFWPGLFPSTYHQSKSIFSQIPFSLSPPSSHAHQPITVFGNRRHARQWSTMQRESDNEVQERLGPDLLGDDGPSLIVAIEKDALADHASWRGGDFTRGLQVHQWTLAARPNHPVFMDVLGRIMRTSKEVREGRMADPGALDFTGPAV